MLNLHGMMHNNTDNNNIITRKYSINSLGQTITTHKSSSCNQTLMFFPLGYVYYRYVRTYTTTANLIKLKK